MKSTHLILNLILALRQNHILWSWVFLLDILKHERDETHRISPHSTMTSVKASDLEQYLRSFLIKIAFAQENDIEAPQGSTQRSDISSEGKLHEEKSFRLYVQYNQTESGSFHQPTTDEVNLVCVFTLNTWFIQN